MKRVVPSAAMLTAFVALGACKSAKSGDTAAQAADAGDDPGSVELIEAGPTAFGAPAPIPSIAALASPTPVFSAPEFPPKDPSRAADERQGVVRLGSIRKGQLVPVKPDVLKKGNCPEGWFKLVAGGYVCGKFATLDLTAKDLQDAPHAPFADGPLPYEYGLNLTNGTPLYRRPPLKKERNQYEKGLLVGKNQKVEDRTAAAKEIASEKGETPWYLKDHGGQRPQVTFSDLKGESGLVEQRMVRGFYVALDQQVRAFAGKFWRTTRGNYIPFDHILVHKTKTEFEGVWVGKDEEQRKLPLGYSLGLYARSYRIEEGSDKPKRAADKIPRFTIFPLTGKKSVFEQRTYYETNESFWLRDIDATAARAVAPPADLVPGEKWIDVNLSTQTLVAYEGEKPVFATLVSSGRHDDNDKSKDHRTPTGSFRIREKHVSTTMDDDSASDGPYSIQDVPWVMYFEKGYALHGAFWHASFGHERSHGCVNLQPIDARQIFQWAGPTLPEGWHAVRATNANEGTRVIVHE